MHPVIRNILAVVLGFIGGSVVNMVLVKIGASVVPPPPGADMQTMEGMRVAMAMFDTSHFIFPFLAHALGTLAGAAIAARLALSRKLELAMLIGALFLAGGVSMVLMLPSPLWFTLLDLVLAYLPMAYLGYKLATFRQGPAGVQPA